MSREGSPDIMSKVRKTLAAGVAVLGLNVTSPASATEVSNNNPTKNEVILHGFDFNKMSLESRHYLDQHFNKNRLLDWEAIVKETPTETEEEVDLQRALSDKLFQEIITDGQQQYLAALQPIDPPGGHTKFCQDYAYHCSFFTEYDPNKKYIEEFTPDNFYLLYSTLKHIRKIIKQETDQDMFGVKEKWIVAVSKGDCEDIALLGQLSLILLGYSHKNLRLLVVYAPLLDEKNEFQLNNKGEIISEGHAVLAVNYILNDKPVTLFFDGKHSEPYTIKTMIEKYRYQISSISKLVAAKNDDGSYRYMTKFFVPEVVDVK